LDLASPPSKVSSRVGAEEKDRRGRRLLHSAVALLSADTLRDVLRGVNLRLPVLSSFIGDFSEVVDYRTALEQVAKADEAFMALPAKVRARFSNDAAEFLDFVHNPANKEELVSMGLANPPVVERTQADPAVVKPQA